MNDFQRTLNDEEADMDEYSSGSMHSSSTWNPPSLPDDLQIKQEPPDFDRSLESSTSYDPYNAEPPDHQFMPSPYFTSSHMQDENQTYVAGFEQGMNEPDGQAPKKRGRKKKLKAEEIEGMNFEPGQPIPIIRKRGRPRKYPISEGYEYIDTPEGKKMVKQEKITETFKVRKKIDRFEGMPEEEVAKRTLPDHLVPNLDIVIIGINPGLFAAFKGHHYAGPGNHFWRCLFLAGLIPEPMTAMDDYKLVQYGIGFTNIVARTTRSSADLSRKEIKEGAEILLDKLKQFQPRIAVFNGKGIYEIFSGNKHFVFGRQPKPIEGTNVAVFVMPSSSARCAQLPRAVDKLPFYVALKKLRDHLRGHLPHLDPSEVTFPDVKLKVEIKEDPSIDDDTNESDMFDMNSMEDGHNSRGGDDGAHVMPKRRGRRPKNQKLVEDHYGGYAIKEEGNMYPLDNPGPKKRGRKKKCELAQMPPDYSVPPQSLPPLPPPVAQDYNHHNNQNYYHHPHHQPQMAPSQQYHHQQAYYHQGPPAAAQALPPPSHHSDGYPVNSSANSSMNSTMSSSMNMSMNSSMYQAQEWHQEHHPQQQPHQPLQGPVDRVHQQTPQQQQQQPQQQQQAQHTGPYMAHQQQDYDHQNMYHSTSLSPIDSNNYSAPQSQSYNQEYTSSSSSAQSPTPPGSNWAYPSTYEPVELTRTTDFPSWLKHEPLDPCETGY